MVAVDVVDAEVVGRSALEAGAVSCFGCVACALPLGGVVGAASLSGWPCALPLSFAASAPSRFGDEGLAGAEVAEGHGLLFG